MYCAMLPSSAMICVPKMVRIGSPEVMGAPSANARVFLSSLKAVHDCFELRDDLARIRSRRLKGLADECYSKKRETKRALGFADKVRATIMEVAMDAGDSLLTYMACFISFLDYGRQRAPDGSRIEVEPEWDSAPGGPGRVRHCCRHAPERG